MKQSALSCIYILLLTACTFASVAWSANTDPDTIWPLCGRITDNPPPGWVDSDGCPSIRNGDATYSDEPLSSTFGPRPLASENNRYDFHRGVDIATPIGTPFFAITDGIVEIAGNHSSYSDPLVKLRHFRSGEFSCNAGGCYHSFYLHISSWVVAEDDTVVKGQLLGYTGESGSGFDHVHFEVRDAPDFDVFSAWSRDAIHPLSVVPYAAPNNSSIVFNAVDLSNPTAGVVDLTLTSNRYDLYYVGLTLLDSDQQPVAQNGNTPDARGYYVAPPFFDMEVWNFQYSHKNSSAIPWSDFGAGGVYECPYHADHGASYNANVHMDQQDPADFHHGLFNGLNVRTQKYWPSDSSDYTVDLQFQALEGSGAVCVQADAVFASGDTAMAEWGTCEPVSNQPPVAVIGWNCQGLSCDFDGSQSSDLDGSIVSYSWDFGDGATSSLQNPTHEYATAGQYPVSLTVTDNGDLDDSDNVSITVSPPPAWIDQVAEASIPGSGTVSGALGNTHDDDGAVQSIREIESGGKKSNRHSYLEHAWQFTVAAGSAVTVYANAWSSGSSDGDVFEFEWSTDNASFSSLFSISSTDVNNVQSAPIPADGTIFVRVIDSDRSSGNRTLDTIFVDHLYIRTENGTPPDPPAAPTALSVDSSTSNSISVSWSHPGADESGFELQRSPAASASWSTVGMPAAESTAYTDSGLSPSSTYDYRLRAMNAGGESGWSNTATGSTDAPPPVSIELSATSRVKRGQQEVKLSWSGASGSTVDILRDDALVVNTNNDGRYTDKPGGSGASTYSYKVCETGSANCSNEVTVIF